MDTSETYIKMRVGAKADLLDGTPPDVSIPINAERGLYVETQKWISDKVFVDLKGDFYYSTGKDYCQLERQDQLQEMVEEKRPYLLLMELDIEANSGLASDEGWNDYWRSFTSMEQLWLAFVMKEKYNKTWDGTDWIIKQNGQIV